MIYVYTRPVDIIPQKFVNCTAVVVDVLRASTTIIIALYNGCREIVPTDDVDRAFDIAATLPSQNVLLAGERNGLKVEGFDLGNSPAEYTPAMVGGRILVYTTTNGTQAIKQSSQANEVVIAALINLSAAAQYLCHVKTDVAIVCAGRQGQPSLEDAVCAGLLVEKMVQRASAELELSNAAQEVIALAQDYKPDLLSMLQMTDAGQYLIKLGHSADLEICARLNSVNTVPVYRYGVIQAMGCFA